MHLNYIGRAICALLVIWHISLASLLAGSGAYQPTPQQRHWGDQNNHNNANQGGNLQTQRYRQDQPR
jgi:hypothetical protein